ncbi:5-hydroxyisourate hydrolase-like [Sinocyclocheilus rhinocerous]|uniref:5-hydroxyisourate hydrolase-like n=1 Tax=Sinocyclocheilus rhinocerous TaxID=307959 RepID=UPI0007BACB05|nr:PREDICTED: 5-hydroxyisourate hydrolase-like [Sinocyclocheilus rhinocerous]
MGPSVKSSSPITTHVLNTGDGVPAARVALSLHRLDPRMAIWNLITIGWEVVNTNEDGFTPGMYKIRFETGQYWESLGQSSFYPYVEILIQHLQRELVSSQRNRNTGLTKQCLHLSRLSQKICFMIVMSPRNLLKQQLST